MKLFVKEARERSGMTLDGLAGKSGVARSYLQRLESSNPPNPSIGTLCKLSRCLNVPVGELFACDSVEPK